MSFNDVHRGSILFLVFAPAQYVIFGSTASAREAPLHLLKSRGNWRAAYEIVVNQFRGMHSVNCDGLTNGFNRVVVPGFLSKV